MAEKIVIAELDLNTQGIITNAQSVKTQLLDLRAAQAELKKSGEEGSAQFIRNEADIKKLSSTYNVLKTAITAQVNENGKLVSATQRINGLISQEAVTVNEAREQNSLMLKLRNDLNPKIAEEAAQIAALNKKYDENIAFIKENTSAYENLKMNIGDYKNQIVEAANEMNPFNGGISGFVSRAQAAGGVMPLLSAGLTGVIAGIRGMTAASLTFLATPIGAAIGLIAGALALIINYLKGTQEGMDKLTAITRPLQAIFQSFGTLIQNVGKWLVDAFSNPKKTLIELGEFVKQNLINRFTAFAKILDGIINLDFKKTADGVLQLGTGVENMTGKLAGAAKATGKFLDDAVKRGQEIDKLNKDIERSQISAERNAVKYNDIIDAQKEIVKDTSKSFKEREAAAQQIIAASQKIGDEEAAIIQKRIKLFNLELGARKATREEQQKLAELETALDAAQDKGHDARLENMKVISGLRKEQADQAAKAAAEAKSKAEEAVKLAIELQKLQLEEYRLLNAERAKSVDEAVAYNQKIYDETVKTLNAEFNASKKTEVDKQKLKNATLQAGLELQKANTEAVVKNAEQEYQEILRLNKAFLKDGELLDDEKVKREKERLSNIAQAQIDNARLTLTNAQEIADAELAIYNKLATDKAAVDKTFSDQQKAAKLLDIESRRIIEGEAFQFDLETRLSELETKRLQERAAAEKAGADMIAFDQATAEARKSIELDVALNKMSLASTTFGNLATIVGKESAVGKAMAITQATIDTYKSAVSAYSSMAGIPVVGPALGAIAAAAAVASGIANVRKISSTKTPKAEKGALFSIGGKRHSAGGTMFTGADGTQFEAEQGELIGVMNRNAARHFMAFNNAFPAGGGSMPNYFASGGIVQRETAMAGVNMDELASKIAIANSTIPAPIVAVQDIISGVDNRAQVVSAANF